MKFADLKEYRAQLEIAKACRTQLGMSQSKLARLSGVTRFKICTSELGDTILSPEDLGKIQKALYAEAVRLRKATSIMIGKDAAGC